MPEQVKIDANPHQEAEELLPWYATGQLRREEQQIVERHLASCAHCRRQLAFEHRISDEFAASSPEADEGWERLKRRLHNQPIEPGWRRGAGRAIWQTLSRPAVAAVAAAQLAFLAIAATLLFSLSQPSYRALSSTPPPQSANVIVMFRAETTEAELRSLLDANGARLVDGPTATDAYLLRVAPTSRAAALARLQADRHVVMAQPIDGATS